MHAHLIMVLGGNFVEYKRTHIHWKIQHNLVFSWENVEMSSRKREFPALRREMKSRRRESEPVSLPLPKIRGNLDMYIIQMYTRFKL